MSWINVSMIVLKVLLLSYVLAHYVRVCVNNPHGRPDALQGWLHGAGDPDAGVPITSHVSVSSAPTHWINP